MSANSNAFSGCGIILLVLVGIFFFPYIAIPVVIILGIIFCQSKKQKKTLKSQDEQDLEDIKKLLRKRKK